MLRSFAAAAGLVCLSGPALAAAGGSFVENFERLDPSRWYTSDGWSNGEHQNCVWSKNEVRIENGILQLGFSKPAASDKYRCAEVQTNAEFSYGTYEARFKTPAGSGLNAAFFTYMGPPHTKIHDEIDFEVLLKDTGSVQTGGFANGKGVPPAWPAVPGKSDAAFHDYAFVWSPEGVKYYIDGKLVHTVADPNFIQKTNQKIYFSLWSTSQLVQWMGEFKPPQEPLTMSIDWLAYTAAGDKCQFPESLVCKLPASP